MIYIWPSVFPFEKIHHNRRKQIKKNRKQSLSFNNDTDRNKYWTHSRNLMLLKLTTSVHVNTTVYSTPVDKSFGTPTGNSHISFKIHSTHALNSFHTLGKNSQNIVLSAEHLMGKVQKLEKKAFKGSTVCVICVMACYMSLWYV